MQKALSTLPWVEPGSVRGNVSDQTATFQVKQGEKCDEDALRKTIDTKTTFKMGNVLDKSNGGG